jgi:hypothetical protein
MGLAGNSPQNPDVKRLRYQNLWNQRLRAGRAGWASPNTAIRMLSELACGKQGHMSQVGGNILGRGVEMGIGGVRFASFAGLMEPAAGLELRIPAIIFLTK